MSAVLILVISINTNAQSVLGFVIYGDVIRDQTSNVNLGISMYAWIN